jgi:DedD protein
MALFKFRKAGEEPVAQPAQPESIEALRRRARHRLIGATVLVLVGVIGFPLLFDTQPRPIPVDIPIEIPDRNKAKPLAPLPSPATQAPVATGTITPAPVASATVAAAAPAPKTETPAAPAPAASVAVAAPKAESPPQVAKAEAKPESKPEPKPAANAEDGARAKALLEGKSVDVTEGRFVVQVGAFADATKARETRQRVEKAGLKTYTHVAETKDGKRIRVRVGPFASRAEADKAAQKIKGLDLPAAVLTL